MKLKEIEYEVAKINVVEIDTSWERYLEFLAMMSANALKGTEENGYLWWEFPDHELEGYSLQERAKLKETWKKHPELWDSEDPDQWARNWKKLEILALRAE